MVARAIAGSRISLQGRAASFTEIASRVGVHPR
jgi:hypothetical protein